MWRKNAPIIRSAIETDVYKILMLYYIWTYYPYLKVKWEFTNRKKEIYLAKYVSIELLREQLQEVAKLRFSNEDIAYIHTWGMFPTNFLRDIQKLQLTLPDVREINGQLAIEIEGTWMESTLWEIYILAIVAELYGQGRAKTDGITESALYDEGMKRAQEKIKFLKQHPELKIALFGLRRRASGQWEELITEMFLNETHNIVGVSNVYLAKKYKVEALGTNAHELAMAEYAISRHMNKVAVRQSPYEILRKWERLYSYKALIMLSDTFGTDAFLQDLSLETRLNWSGHRQDSGDPFAIGEKIISDYESRGIDPRDKKILFTDGLDCQKMLKLYESFHNRIQVGFGWGTNHSNDLGLVKPLSIVMKLTEAGGNPTVKLSDNLAKAMGPDDEILIAKQIFGYTNEFDEAPTY